MARKGSGDMSYETKTIIVILLLLFILPAGLVLMWLWMKWPIWLKILITVIPFLFAFLVAAFVGWILVTIFSNPSVQKQIQESISIEKSQSENHKLRTYNNKLLSYQFQYPSNWTINTIGKENIEIQSPDFRPRYNGAIITITVTPTTETSVEKELEKPHGGLLPENVQKVTVDGLEAIRMNNRWEGIATLTFFIKDGYFYNIQIVSYNDNDYKNNLPIYNSLISSFKFTK